MDMSFPPTCVINSESGPCNFRSHLIMSTMQTLCPPEVQNDHILSSPRLLVQHGNDSNHGNNTPVSPSDVLALPSDVYNDFEALRSATKLDSPALMRRLLKYYNKLTSSTVNRERKLDDVIEGIRGRNSSSSSHIMNNNDNNNNNSNNNNNAATVLDLSVHKKPQGPENTESCSLDQITAEDSIESQDLESSPRPLDLTLQKESSVVGLSGNTEPMESVAGQHGATSSLFSTSFKTTTTSSCGHSSTELAQAAPYVINLESLTSTIQLSTPTQANESEQRNGIQLPAVYDSKSLGTLGPKTSNERQFLHSLSQKPSNSSVLANSHNVKTSILATTTQISPNDCKSSSSYPPSALFPMTNTALPSYREAINSSLLSKHNIVSGINSDSSCASSHRNIIASDARTNNDVPFKKSSIDFASHLISSDGRQISVLQLNPDFNSVKSGQSMSTSTTESFLLDTNNQKHSPSHDTNLAPNLLLSDSLPILSSRLTSQSSSQKSLTRQENTSSSFTLNNSDHQGQRIQVPYVATNATNSQPSSAIVSGNAIHTILSTATPSSQGVYPQSSMPLQSLLMSQTSDGSVSSVVAIPVLQGLPEGYTTLQHFTFESSVPLPSKSEMQNASITTASLPMQPIIVSAPLTTNDNPFTEKTYPITNPASSVLTMPPNSDQTKGHAASTEPNKGWVKLKPGRPKGRTGKMNSPRKTQNKGMKLVTENSLFPGVYTSILKLPWSKRTRNKSKAKPEGLRNNQEVHNEHNVAGTLNVEIEGKKYVADTNFVPPELSDVVKDPVSESLEDQLKGARNEAIMSQIQRKHISLDQQHQTHQFHHQYQVRLNEEHQKTTIDADASVCLNRGPCASPVATCPSNSTFADSLHYSNMNIKREICDPSEICSEIRHNVMLSSASIAAGQEQSNISNSHDPIMLIYPNIGPNGSKSKKRRGRPPKKPIVEPKAHQDTFLFPVESIFHPSDSMSDSSFLHGANSNLTLIPSVSQEFTLMSPTTLTSSLLSAEKTDPNTIKSFNGSSDVSNGKQDHDQTTLENRIIYLTNQIEMEMAREANNLQPKEHFNVDTVAKQRTEQHTLPEQNTMESSIPPIKLEDKPPQGVKRRRKKTSRMLKSNENFVYATFRFKPRGGSGIKKTKKKRKVSTTSLTVNAETIANLRNKKLKCTDGASHKSDTETRNELGVQSWKFHEQYPSEPRAVKSPVPTLSIVSCASCSLPVRKIQDVPNNLHYCHSCQTNKIDEAKDDSGSDSPYYDEHEMCNSSSEVEKDGLSLFSSCVSCGKKFEGFSDSDSQCEICKRSTQSFISSSKLFSIHQRASPSTVSNPPSSDCDQQPESTTKYASFDSQTPLTTDGILFCYLCRMQFTKIQEYLLHLKETHETPPIGKSVISSPRQDADLENGRIFADSTPRKIKSTLKTKKSLAHKTITCPVEDCPLFFRHQRDMDHHLKKVHQSNPLLSPREILPATSDQTEISTIHNQLSTGQHRSKGMCSSVEDTSVSVFDQHPNANPVTITLEENGDDFSTHDQTQEKPLRCSFCNFRCRQKNAMTWHMRKHPEAASQHRCYSSASSE